MSALLESSTFEDNIWISSSDGDIRNVIKYLSSVVNINSQDEYGYSPL